MKLKLIRYVLLIVESARDVPYMPELILRAHMSVVFKGRQGRLILFLPPIPQQIQISVDQSYAGPAASCCVIIRTHSIFGGKWADWAKQFQYGLKNKTSKSKNLKNLKKSFFDLEVLFFSP
jgi:hypothetical protein